MESGSGSLAPREHGAYAMLTYPVLSGFLLGGPSPAGVGFTLLVVAAFLAHEPLTVVLGQRGDRLRKGLGPRGRVWLLWLGALSLLGGGLVAGSAGWAGLGPVLPPVVPGAVVLALTLMGRSKTMAGELLVAVAFGLVHVPIAMFGGAESWRAWGPATVWVVGFLLTTVAVHSLKRRFKGRGPHGWTVAGARVGSAVALGLAILLPLAWNPAMRWTWAYVPLGAAVLLLSFLAVHPRYLVRVGWTIVAAETTSLVAMAALA